MKILVVEDDPHISEYLYDRLKSEGFTVDVAFDGLQGSYMARTNIYDVIVLDYSLPKKNGLLVCDEIREDESTVPIIFLSVTGDSKTKIAALEKGADDYITKPFSYEELRARIKALIRRPHKIESPIIKAGELTIDTDKQSAYRNGNPIYLTRKEYSLLEYLMKNIGVILSRSMIMEHVWNAEGDPFSNTVEAHILNLRRKINAGNQQELIRNIPGRGYVIEV